MRFTPDRSRKPSRLFALCKYGALSAACPDYSSIEANKAEFFSCRFWKTLLNVRSTSIYSAACFTVLVTRSILKPLTSFVAFCFAMFSCFKEYLLRFSTSFA